MSDPKLSARDMEIVSKVFQCFQSADAMKIDYEKLAQLAGFSNSKSANASWCVIKKKLMNGAAVDSATTGAAPKNKAKPKPKATAIADADEDDEATSTKPAPKKRAKAIKAEPAEAEIGDADNEITPSAESPKKGRAKKTTAPAKTDINGDDIEIVTPTPKRKRGPNKPKDPNAPPAKRAKKGANAAATETTADDAANAQLHADHAAAQTNGEGSIFGGDANIKQEDEEEEEGDDRPFDAEEQKMRDDALFNLYSEGQVA